MDSVNYVEETPHIDAEGLRAKADKLVAALEEVAKDKAEVIGQLLRDRENVKVEAVAAVDAINGKLRALGWRRARKVNAPKPSVRKPKPRVKRTEAPAGG